MSQSSAGRFRPRLLAPALAATLACSFGASAAQGETLQAAAASDYRDSIGVQMHMDFNGFAYMGTPTDKLVTAVNALGIRHIRDRTCQSIEAECAPIRQRLAAVADGIGAPGAGGDLLLRVMPNVEFTHDRAERDRLIRQALEVVRDTPMGSRAIGLESVNEPDLVKTGGEALWTEQTIQDSRTLKRLRALPEFKAIRHIPVYAPPMGRPPATMALIKAGWTPDLADAPNSHPYPPTHNVPERALLNDCEPTKDVFDCGELIKPGVAPIASESGYSTAGTLLVADWVSSQAQAIYTLRLMLHNYQSGVRRTYLYELIDLEDPSVFRNHGYGLISSRRKADGTMTMGPPKAVYTAIRRMHSVIGELGAPENPGSIDVKLTDPATGMPVPETELRRLVLQRADGTFVLAVWRPEKSWKFENYKPVNLPVAHRTIDLALDGSKGGWDAKVFQPLTQDEPVATSADTAALSVNVDDEVTLIDLTPPAALRKPYVKPVDPKPVDPIDPVVPDPVGPGTDTGGPITAPSTDAPRPGAGSQTAKPKAQLPTRSQAAAAREKANRRARAKARARLAYDACLRRQVAQAQRRKPKGSARLHPKRPTPQMRARCGRSPGR